jgi:hypothetical protein
MRIRLLGVLVVAAAHLACVLPIGLPPATNVARFVRTSWDADAKPTDGKVAATAAGLYATSVGGNSGSGSAGQVFTAEASARFNVASRYQLAPTVSTMLLGLDAQALLVTNATGSLGLLHGVGVGLGFQSNGSGSSSTPNVLYTTLNAGLLGQLHAGPGTAYLAVRYAYGTGAPFGGTSTVGLNFTPSHYVLGNVGYLVRFGSVFSVSPEFSMGWMKPVPSGTATSSDLLIFAPSVTAAADF